MLTACDCDIFMYWLDVYVHLFSVSLEMQWSRLRVPSLHWRSRQGMQRLNFIYFYQDRTHSPMSSITSRNFDINLSILAAAHKTVFGRESAQTQLWEVKMQSDCPISWGGDTLSIRIPLDVFDVSFLALFLRFDRLSNANPGYMIFTS